MQRDGWVRALPKLYPTLSLSWKAGDHPGASLVVMRRALTLILGCALFGIFAAVVVASPGADDPANHDSTTTGTVEQRTTTTEDNPARERRHDDAKENEDV